MNFFPETDFSTAAGLLNAILSSLLQRTLCCTFPSKSLTSFSAQWGSPKENTSTLLIGSSTGAQRGLWLIWPHIRRHLLPRERRILLLGLPAQLWVGQLLNQVQLTALSLPQLHVNLDKASTRIPQPPRTEDEWGKFPCPSVIWVQSMAKEREAHCIYFSRAPWMENPLSSLGCPSCWLPAVFSWTILYTFWCGSFLHSLPSLLWPSLANFSLLII